MKIRNWPIRTRAIILAAVPAFLTVVFLTALHMIQRWSDADENSESTVQLMVESISASAEYPIISGNYDLLAPLIDAALSRPEIALVRIMSPEGGVLIEEKVPGFEEIAAGDIRIFRKSLLRDVVELDGFSEFGELMVMSQELAIIEIGMTGHYTRARDLEILYQSVITGILVVLLAALTGRYIALMIVRPLERVAGFISSLANGDYWNRTEESEGAELGHLQESSNRLAQALETAQRKHEEFTEKLLLEQKRAKAASKAKSQFLAMMSHELRTPLNGAMGMLELIEQKMPTAEFNEHRHQAEQSLVHLSQLLDDIMVVADTDQKSLAASPEYCVLSEYLEPLFESLRIRAMSQGLSFIADVAPRLRSHAVLTYPGLLRQILRHLTDNALKFTRQGMISVSLSPVEGGIRVIVTDTGIGIPEDAYDTILQPFTQLESDLNRHFDGAGLGLTITSHVVSAMNGRLSFSPQVGGGLVVQITLPEIQASAGAEMPETQCAGRLLIVEDNEVNLKVAEKMLARIHPDREVVAVMSGEAALEAVAREDYDLVLMDCQMPGMDGFETSEKLREKGFTGAIVACTANTTDQVEERCLASGMNDYMAKPISLEGLRLMTGRWLPERDPQ